MNKVIELLNELIYNGAVRMSDDTFLDNVFELYSHALKIKETPEKVIPIIQVVK